MRERRATQGVSPVSPCHNLGINIISIMTIVTVIDIIVVVVVIITIKNLPLVRLHGQDQTEFDDLISALRYFQLDLNIFQNIFKICQLKRTLSFLGQIIIEQLLFSF